MTATVREELYIAGRWRRPASDESLDILNPASELVIGSVPLGSAADARVAVEAAAAAQDAWARLPVRERADRLGTIADGLQARRDELIELLIAEVGTPRRLAERMQVDIAIATFRDAADLVAAELEAEEVGSAVVAKEPVGVVACITPWNYPLYQAALKVAPALAAGCTVVLKPSELACLSLFVLAEVIDASGLEPGVFNLVTGTGSEVGEALVSDPSVDMVTFTGSGSAGRRVAEVAAAAPKRVTLELGGKGASVVLEDGDLPGAVTHVLSSCLGNAGQTCAALTRLIVPRGRLAEAEALIADAVGSVVLGDPSDAETTLGPVVSAVQRERVLAYVDTGVKEGARLLTGDPRAHDTEAGYYVPATVFSDVTPDMTIAREEIFGPVLVVLAAADDEEAIAIANATPYGLSGAVWSADPSRARDAARRLHASTVYINGAGFNPRVPFGGYRGSGYGRERGRHGIAEFVQTKGYVQ